MTEKLKIAADVALADLAWLSLVVRAGMGALTFTVTEDGNIGIFSEDGPAWGTGDTAEEALGEAHREWHKGGLPEQRTECRCVALDEEGLSISDYVGSGSPRERPA